MQHVVLHKDNAFVINQSNRKGYFIMTQLSIKQTVSAFTKTAKDANGKVLREAIGKFNFDVALSLDLATEKMQQVVATLIIDAVKVSVQNLDRAELWDSESIAQKFADEFAKFDEDTIYKLVCTRENNNFGLQQFKAWVLDTLIPCIEDVTPLDEESKATIIGATKGGRAMNDKSMAKVLQWIDTYCTDADNVEQVLHYLTSKPQTVTQVDLDSLGF